MAKKRRTGTCGLCGDVAETSREHFVPQCLWDGPLPNMVETVPACDNCNAGTSDDDEYFRNTLVMMFDQDHPQKKGLFEGAVHRSLKQNIGNVKELLSKMTVRPMFSPGGLWLGDFPVMPLDAERFNGSLVKIVKGLYFKIRKQPFPKTGTVGIIGVLNAETKPMIEMIESSLSPIFNFGDNVFEWQFAQTTFGATMWKFSFYQSASFYAIGYEDAAELKEKLAACEATA